MILREPNWSLKHRSQVILKGQACAMPNIQSESLAQGFSRFRSMYKSLRSLRWTRKVVDLRIYHDARALRKVCENARTSGRVTEGQLYWCSFGMHKSISSALPKGTPFYLRWMPQTRSPLLKCQLEQKYILDFITLNSKKCSFPVETYWNSARLSCYSLTVKRANFHSTCHAKQLTQTTRYFVVFFFFF